MLCTVAGPSCRRDSPRCKTLHPAAHRLDCCHQFRLTARPPLRRGPSRASRCPGGGSPGGGAMQGVGNMWWSVPVTTWCCSEDDMLGRNLGNYGVVSKIGEGGMGVV